MARETGKPFIGTCNGFQHVMIEYARNVLGFPDAGHAERNPGGTKLFVRPWGYMATQTSRRALCLRAPKEPKIGRFCFLLPLVTLTFSLVLTLADEKLGLRYARNLVPVALFLVVEIRTILLPTIRQG